MSILLLKVLCPKDNLFLGYVREWTIGLHKLVKLFLDIETIKLHEANDLSEIFVVDAICSDPCRLENAIIKRLCCIYELKVLFGNTHLIVLQQPEVEELDHARLLKAFCGIHRLRLIGAPDTL